MTHAEAIKYAERISDLCRLDKVSGYGEASNILERLRNAIGVGRKDSEVILLIVREVEPLVAEMKAAMEAFHKAQSLDENQRS